MSEASFLGRPVRAVLFDYGLTLMTFTRPDAALHQAYTRIAAMLPRRQDGGPWDPDELLLAVHDRVDEQVDAHIEQGHHEEIDITAAHRAAYAALGIELDDGTLDEAMHLEQMAWWQGMHLAPGVAPTLAALRENGLRVGVCSNAPYRPASMREQLEFVGLLPMVDAAVFSGEVGWRKPSPRIFEHALRALGSTAGDTVMVGDRVREDVGGAHAAGMRAVLLREHYADRDPEGSADAVLDRLTDLPDLLGLTRR